MYENFSTLVTKSYVDQLCKLRIGDFPFFVLSKVKFDKLTVEIEGYFSIQSGVFNNILKFTYKIICNSIKYQ